MKEYFEAELRLLHESAQEFAKAYPEQAGMLNLKEIKDRDPYVERLLEGMAYLTAQIRQHIDDDIPEISETLLSQLWPHLLRPYPSSTIIQFTPRIGQIQQTQIIEKETLLLSRAVGEDNVICKYSTIGDVVLNPLQISKFELEEPAGGGTIFRLRFEFDAGISVTNIDLTKLKIYLHADPAVALWLHHQLTGEVARLRVMFPEYPTFKPHEIKGKQGIMPAHLDSKDSVVKLSGTNYSGYHLLLDYFCFREKYMFIEINGLAQVKWPKNISQFELEIKINGICPPDHRLSKENFRLHCAVARNLFKQDSEPVYLTHQKTNYKVVADSAVEDGIQVYSLDKVVGFDPETGETHEYYPMSSFMHRKYNGRYYHSFRRNQGTGRAETYLTVGGAHEFRTEMLSCTITASNGDYPRQYLRENSVNFPSDEFPSYASYTNITRPTAMLPPPERSRFHWELISHLSLNYSSLASLSVLKRLLGLYDWTNHQQNKKRIEGITKIEIKPVERFSKGALMRGLEVNLTLVEDNYRSISDIHLFGNILHNFFSMYSAVNSFVQTRVYCHPSNKELTWEPLPGENSPL